MGLFSALSRTASLIQDSNTVKGGRKEIMQMKSKLEGTPQFATLFYKLITDVNHPPRYIEATQTGDFWSENWEAATSTYEPYTTIKHSDRNIGYCEGCAMYLLIQDCYPNVYDFPGNTISDIQNGATIKLIMKQQFVGKALGPAKVPTPVAAQPAAPATQAPTATPAFCSHCGTKLAPGSAFCSGCGTKIG